LAQVAAAIWLAGLVHASPVGPAFAGDVASLYTSDAIVTGTGEVNRQIGFRECLGEVLVKLSGDPTIINAPGYAALRAEAGRFVSSFSYRDRMEGIPIHDEQGTHDRPHDLTCGYERKTLDPLLADLGRKPWLAPRPSIAVFVAVKDQRRRFVLTRDGSESPYMADSLKAASVPLGLATLLPDASTATARQLDFDRLSQARTGELVAATAEVGGDVALAGTVIWSDAERGWVADWRMDAGGKPYRWRTSGVSFDEAFRVAMRGSARILSGNGAP
jgi:hypothetical protein